MLYAYISKTLLNPESLKEILSGYTYTVEDMEDRDWNEEWEKSGFTPIVIDNRCVICGSNHTGVPDAEYRITINPKMSFGSGHHQTTASMLRWLLRDNFRGKRVLDMGCGTAVLGILASMRGASEVDGIDIDEWSVLLRPQWCEHEHIARRCCASRIARQDLQRYIRQYKPQHPAA